MKKGFTLVELLGVIVILSLLAVLTFPSILNFIKKGNDYIDESTEKLIYSAAKSYIKDNQDDYPKEDDSEYCISISNLIDSDNIKESILSKDIIENKIVKVIYKNGYNYSVVDNKDCIMAKDFATDSWETIAQAFKYGTYKGIYNLGEEKEVDMGEFGTHTVRIANLPDSSHTEFCSNSNNSQTACGVVIEFVDVITKHVMNSTNTGISGYPASELHTYIESTIYSSLPEELQDAIIDTYVVSSHVSNDINPNRTDGNWESIDKLYLLSPAEIYGSSYNYRWDSAYATTRQLDYYSNNNVTKSNCSLAIKKLNGTAKTWWLRDISSYGDNNYDVHINGYINVVAFNISIHISPAFRLESN